MTRTGAEAALETLHHELGGELPHGVDALETQHLVALNITLRKAKQRQQAQIEAALQSALDHLPALLRGTVRKLFDA